MKKCMDAPNLHRHMKKIMGQLNAIDKVIDADKTIAEFAKAIEHFSWMS